MELESARLIAAGAAATIAAPVVALAAAPDRAVMRAARSPRDRLLHAMSLRMARARSEREVGEVVVTELTNLIDYHSCRFYMLSDDGDAVVPIAHDGVIAEYEDDRTADLVCRVGEGVAGRPRGRACSPGSRRATTSTPSTSPARSRSTSR